MTVAWFQCNAGIAGDMALGACIDAGARADAVRAGLARLDLTEWSLEIQRTTRCGISAIHVQIDCDESESIRSPGEITAMITAAGLAPRVTTRARTVFERLAQAEATVHGADVASVHFHEVGQVDAIVDIVGTCLALEELGIDDIQSSPIATGYGSAKSSHGITGVPAPAVVELLRGAPHWPRTPSSRR